ncbi:putative hydrophobic surface binding protein a protein [Botrytis fragariae]|uniref:Putative hydrophobic surface binding protein a protein n=1 Tax=Botrytis fragariae TaxID=1964551 RepID=A0A8H6AJN6_9HELO|nr:putative hydrophobic surface binding protein a protein [Botrytis fragariae]KAF5868483.1 putative hydrophobic surface binding protein a protein [Botrytis fragariae]
MVSIKALAFYLATMAVAVSAAPAAAVKSVTTADTVIADINSIDVQVNVLIGAIAGVKEKTLDSSTVDVDFTTLHLANQQGVTDAAVETPASSEDSSRVVATIETTLSIDIPDAITALEAKKEFFTSDQRTVVLAWLVVLQSDYNTFGELLIERTSEDVIPRAEAAAKLIGDAISAGIAYYSS